MSTDPAARGPRAEAGMAGEPASAATDLVARAAAAYRDSLPVLDASLDARVRAAIRGRPRRAVPLWRWPFAGRVRPVWIPLAAAAAGLVVWLASARSPAPSGPPVAAAAAPVDTVFVQFRLAAPQARSVAVAGSFDGWDPRALPMRRGPAGVWVLVIPLPVGEHSYQFVVDGRHWEPDPLARGREADGFGGTNSVIVVGPKGQVRT